MKSLITIFLITILVLTTLVFQQISPIITNAIMSNINLTLNDLPFYIYAIFISSSGILFFLIFFYFSKLILNSNN